MLIKYHDPTASQLASAVHTQKPFFKQQQEKPRRSLIIHIGPPKTGTTTIQEISRDYKDTLAKDNFVYFGKLTHRRLQKLKIDTIALFDEHCLDQVRSNEFSCWNSSLQILNKNLIKNESILISNEETNFVGPTGHKMTKDYYINLKNAFHDWDILYIVTYRRYAEWLVSSVKQFTNIDSKHFGKWGREGGKRIFPVWNYIHGRLLKKDYSSNKFSNLDTCIPPILEAGLSIKVMNFHKSQDIAANFYCDVLSQTPHTCNYIREKSKTSPIIHNKRSVDTIAYDDIIFNAEEIIKISAWGNMTRIQARERLRAYHQQSLGLNFIDLPLICPPKKALEILLNKSLIFEQLVIPELYYSPQGKQQHEQFFWEMVNKRIFCNVHLPILIKTSWNEVLLALNHSYADAPVSYHRIPKQLLGAWATPHYSE